jgi:hypothetical protein
MPAALWLRLHWLRIGAASLAVPTFLLVLHMLRRIWADYNARALKFFLSRLDDDSSLAVLDARLRATARKAIAAVPREAVRVTIITTTLTPHLPHPDHHHHHRHPTTTAIMTTPHNHNAANTAAATAPSSSHNRWRPFPESSMPPCLAVGSKRPTVPAW